MDKKQFKYDAVSDAIMDMIAAGKYKPGDKLPPEAELTKQFGVSRVTLRESLKKLSMMGVLSIVQGSGTFVEEVTPASFMKPLFPLLAFKECNIEEVYGARIYLEGGACELAALHRTDHDVVEMERMVGEMEKAAAENDWEKYTSYDYQFHLAMTKAGKNEIISMIFGLFWNFLERYLPRINSSDQVVRRSLDLHRQLCQAVARRRPELAGALMREHLHQAKNDLLATMQETAERMENSPPEDDPHAPVSLPR